MNVTLMIRLEEFADMAPRLVGTSGSPPECMAWLQGFLCNGVIVDSMKVMK